MMLRLLIYAVLFYVVWKFIKAVLKYLTSTQKNNPDIKGGREGQSKYKNIEDAKYTEIKDEPEDKEK